MVEKVQMTVGFIGQGYIGKNMADDYKKRGYSVVRYGLENEYVGNKEKIKSCDIVFIAVPTPTTSEGSDYSIVEESLRLVGKGNIAVIKSTVVPGTTMTLQDTYPDITILFSPEFLSKVTAARDAQHPMCTIMGVPHDTEKYLSAATKVHATLPKSPHSFTVSSQSAEHFKYIHNVHGFVRIVLSNLFYDIAGVVDADWNEIYPMIDINPMMSSYYNQPVHKSGRGAGGCCFIKDFAAFRMMYEKILTDDSLGIAVLQALEKKNLALLKATDKDTNIVNDVYSQSDK